MYGLVHELFELDEKFPFEYFETSDKQAFLHFHDCLELNIIKKGSGYYVINGKRYDMVPGDIFIINNKEPHMAVHDDDFLIEVLIFDINLLWRNKGISSFLTPFFSRKEGSSHKISANNPRQPEMAEIFGKIALEHRKKEIGWNMSVEALLMYLLTLIYRCYDEKQELEAANDNFQKMYSRISIVFEYISENFKNDIKLEDLAKEVSLSHHYLCKCFKKVTGKTIFEYIEQMRIQNSCYLLKTTDKSIMEIALESGFNSVNFFNRTFKKILDITPKEYRQRNTDGEFSEI